MKEKLKAWLFFAFLVYVVGGTIAGACYSIWIAPEPYEDAADADVRFLR